jgi:drug/metabolite transporter (DMT)-like permease
MLAIALALGASAGWGSADFLGGLSARRVHILVVAAVSQAAGLVFTVVVVAAGGDGPHDLTVLWIGAVGGLLGAGGLSALYRGLAVGRMGVVAPIAAMSGLVPMAVGLIAQHDRPTTLQVCGIVLAIAGVLLASRAPDHEETPIDRDLNTKELVEEVRAEFDYLSALLDDAVSDRPRPREPREADGGADRSREHVRRRSAERTRVAPGVGLALVAALLLGGMSVALDAGGDRDPSWTIFMVRVSSVTALTLVVAARRPSFAAVRPNRVTLVSAGVLDSLANLLFTLASARGLLSVVSVLGSLYPVVTVMLARVVLDERLTEWQLVGVAGALGGVALISLG